jgi:hypothetical protein
MAFQFTAQYVRDVEERMQGFYQTLSEKDRRRYAAVEARKLGRGGVAYVAKVLGCSTRTIERAASELDQLPNDPAAGRIRQLGGGRKKRSPPSHHSNTI